MAASNERCRGPFTAGHILLRSAISNPASISSLLNAPTVLSTVPSLDVTADSNTTPIKYLWSLVDTPFIGSTVCLCTQALALFKNCVVLILHTGISKYDGTTKIPAS